MNPQSQIDEVLRLIGSAPPPDGLGRRVSARLDAPRRGFPIVRFVATMAIAASVAVGAIAFAPRLSQFTQRDSRASSGFPRTITHPLGAFGGASAAHVPAAPVPVQPTPVNQGRGHSRSAQTALSSADRKPLPRGVALPRELQTRLSVSTANTAVSARR